MLPENLESLLHAWSEASPSVANLIGVSPDDQHRRGYFHTLREIAQQPLTWSGTATSLRQQAAVLQQKLALLRDDRQATLVLTGSGSSFYVGLALEPLLNREMAASVRAIRAGDLLTDLDDHIPKDRPCLVVSFARSGNSPESCGAIDMLLAQRKHAEHIVFTSNPEGNLARGYADEPRVTTILLDERTNERSLVMTSGFTNMWLAARLMTERNEERAADRVDALVAACWRLLIEDSEVLAQLCLGALPRVGVFLGGAVRYGAACAGALKILEMTDGRVPTLAQTFLGLRHGPMCAIDDDAIVVSILSSSSPARDYERDLFLEMDDKGLKPRRVFVGRREPSLPRTERDADVAAAQPVDDEALAILGVVASQIMGMFLSLRLGLSPDAPSKRGIITPVVRNFEIYPT